MFQALFNSIFWLFIECFKFIVLLKWHLLFCVNLGDHRSNKNTKSKNKLFVKRTCGIFPNIKWSLSQFAFIPFLFYVVLRRFNIKQKTYFNNYNYWEIGFKR